MKKSFMSLIVFLATNAFAQDIIVKKDGSTIMSKVLEIGTSEIKYKKFSNQQGPIYTIARSDVMAINYENGEKESIQLAKEADTKGIVIGQPDTQIKLAVGTEIPLQNINYVKAADLYVGQDVNFRVNREIKSNNITLIPYGTIVKGKVYEAKKSSGFGTKGKLGIRIDNITLANGNNIPINDGDIYVTGKNRTPLSVCLFLFVTWPACFITGSKAELPAGYEVISKVAHTVTFTYENGVLTSKILEETENPNSETKVENTSEYPYNAIITKKDNYKIKAIVLSKDNKTISYRLLSKPKGKVYQRKMKDIKRVEKL